MKLLPCSYKGCSDKREHWANPDKNRQHQIVKVPDDFKGDKVYCSIECSMYDKVFATERPHSLTKDKTQFS